MNHTESPDGDSEAVSLAVPTTLVCMARSRRRRCWRGRRWRSLEHEQRALVAPSYPQALRKVGDVYPPLHLIGVDGLTTMDGRESRTRNTGEGKDRRRGTHGKGKIKGTGWKQATVHNKNTDQQPPPSPRDRERNQHWILRSLSLSLSYICTHAHTQAAAARTCPLSAGTRRPPVFMPNESKQGSDAEPIRTAENAAYTQLLCHRSRQRKIAKTFTDTRER